MVACGGWVGDNDQLQSDLKRPPSGTLKSGRLIEVQYKLDRNGSKHDFIDSI